MASIVKRKNKYSVIYTAEDENGVKRQKWESFSTMAEAKKRKSQVEFQQENGTFICPTAKTVKELLAEYVEIYGINTWAVSTYDSKQRLIYNYINPMIGDMKLTDITPRIMDKFYQSLLKVKSKRKVYKPDEEPGYVTPRTVKEIHKLLRSAFNQAVKWELISRNPVQNCTLPKSQENTRDIWDTQTLLKALQACDDPLLSLSINLAFSCSLRMGELLGLTWDCVDISEDSIRKNKASIYVNKELQRISKASLEVMGERDVIYRFPAIFPKNTTALILKPPKTKTSIRKVYLPKTVAELLAQRKAEIEELKEIFGCEYEDYNLVICASNGRPMEGAQINRLFDKLIADNNLPRVVFHSLRHTSTTYKLKLSGGDIKAVQGDTGHAQATMVTERYAHIMDDDRRINAERFEKEFYEKEAKDEPEIFPDSDIAKKESKTEAEALVSMLEGSPELMTLLKAMIKGK